MSFQNAVAREPGFRRRPYEGSHRRPGLLRAVVRPLLGALLLAGLPAVLGLWLLTSDRFALHQVTVSASARVEASWVRRALEPYRGRPLILLRLDQVEATLAAHPWVAGCILSKELPDRLTVKVIERRPVAVVERDGGDFYVDRNGVLIDRASEALDPRLFRVRCRDCGAERLAEAVAVMETVRGVGSPSRLARATKIEVLGPGSMRLWSPELAFPVLVDPQQLEDGLAVLDRYLPEILARYATATAVDLRFKRQIVIEFPEA